MTNNPEAKAGHVKIRLEVNQDNVTTLGRIHQLITEHSPTNDTRQTEQSASDTDQTFPCTLCSKTFTTAVGLKTHFGHQHKEGTFSCQYCDKYFNKVKDVKRHVRKSCKKVTEWSITEVNELQPQKKGKQKQIEAAIKQGNYKCYICDKECGREGAYKTHLRTHTGEKPYACDTCGREFSTNTSLKRHFITHTGRQDHSCHVCGRKFSYETSRDRHMLVHTQEKSYQCDICHRSFGIKTSLDRHVIVHTREQPFACGFCNQTFSFKTSRDRHVRSKHQCQLNPQEDNTSQLGSYPCKYCNKVCTSEANRVKHYKSKHMQNNADSSDKLRFMHPNTDSSESSDSEGNDSDINHELTDEEVTNESNEYDHDGDIKHTLTDHDGNITNEMNDYKYCEIKHELTDAPVAVVEVEIPTIEVNINV